MAYLDDNPPRHQQFRCPRRQRPSGIIGVHTAESFPDEAGPDDGAENVARFIRDRTNYGSYHLLADSDSILQLVRFECVAYHIATHGLNEHTIGISAATQAARWTDLDDDYADAMVRNMAIAAARAARWLRSQYNIIVPARRITLSQALRGERGFLAHGDADPDRRTDPGATFPWSRFLGYYADEMNGDNMPTADEVAEALLNTRVENKVTGETIKIRDLLPYMHEDGVQINTRLTRVEAKVDGIASKVGSPIDTTAIENLTNELAITRELLEQVAAGQITPERLADELHARLAE